MQHIVRRALTSGITGACALGLVAAPAVAAGGTGHTVSQTYHQHGTWTEPGDTDFCTEETVTPTITGNEVEHVTATFSLTAVDPDGNTHHEIGHQVAHIGWNAIDAEPVVNFQKMNMTCS